MDRDWNSGGLILFWIDRISTLVQSFSVGHIDSIMVDRSRSWRFMAFYGNLNANEQCQS